MQRRATIISGACLVVLAGCDPDPASTHVDARIASPGGQVEAVNAEDMGGGATVTPVVSVYLVSPGSFPHLADRVFAKERACDVRIRWLDAHTLAVSFTGRDGSFQRYHNASAPAIDVRVQWRGRDANAGG